MVYVLVTLGILLAAGCARTVTQIVSYGETMVVQVTLQGTMEAVSNRYFMILASSESYKIPLPPPDNIVYEFIEPGSVPQQGAIADYFTNYYSTWSGYTIIEPAGYFIVKGPFTQSQSISREVLSSLGEASTVITYNFRLDRIFGANIPDNIYFDFVTVAWPAAAQKFAKDHLTSTNAYISKVVGSTITINDDENDVIDPALNIIKCTVTMQ
jgi:hypothetical protein